MGYHRMRVTTRPRPRRNDEIYGRSAGSKGTTTLVRPKTYEITVEGQAVPAVVDAFEEFDVVVGAACTTLRAELPDQAALHGAIDRVQALGLELLEVRAVGPPL
jgi:hypothetical protein